MKYIYYIIAIMIVCSGLGLYGLTDSHIKVSHPFLSINDRVISKDEFDKLLKRKPLDINREQFISSVIDKQLLIQEAIKKNINTDESFRRSVQNFYEQALIKILLDRKMNSLVVKVTPKEIEKYKTLMQNKIFITKLIYPTREDVKKKTNATVKRIGTDFTNLSDHLKFIVLNLKKGGLSVPIPIGHGVLVYRLDDLQKKDMSEKDKIKKIDVKRISQFFQDQKKEELLEKWMDKIRKSADIWRKK